MTGQRNPKVQPKPYTLANCFLYAVASPGDLARRLQVAERVLESLANGENEYRRFQLASGRDVQEPRHQLQKLHGRIHKLLARVETPNYLHSVKGRSYISNARAHQIVGTTVKLDIRSFFRSVSRTAVYRFFVRQMACAPDAAMLLAKLLTVDGHLATGSKASQVVAYFSYKGMFDELEELARRHGLVMTCYVDDLTFTGPGAGEFVLNEAHKIIRRHGLRPHKKKVFSRPAPKIITGVAVSRDEIRLPHVRQQKIRAALDLADAAPAGSPAERTNLVKLASRLTEAAEIDPRAYGGKVRAVRRRLSDLKGPST